MTDTVRSVVALQALLADGAAVNSTTRQILRDMLVSLDNEVVVEAAARVSVDATEAATRALFDANIGGFNVKNAPYNAVGNGVVDDTTAILAADAAAAVSGGTVVFPPGTYKTSQNLVVSRKWQGVPGATVIQPTSAVTKCIDLRAGGRGDGIDLDGVNTTGKTGLDVGTAGIANILSWEKSTIHNFLGVGGRGMKVATLVTGFFENLYVYNNYINLHTNGGNTPTDTLWSNCQFRTATTKGVWIETGVGLRFLKPLFESNGEEGLYFQNTGGVAAEIEIDGGWSEGNWATLIADPTNRALKFSAFVDGANGPAGTIRAKFKNHKYDNEVAGAIHLTNAIAFLVDACHVLSTGGSKITVDGTSYGTFDNWPEQNGAFNTKVTMPAVSPGVAPAGFNARQRIEDQEAAWTTYTPAYSGSGSMTFTSVTNNLSAYKLVGKTLTVTHTFIGTTGGSIGQSLKATLPTGMQSKSSVPFLCAMVSQDGGNVYDFAIAQPDGVGPTSTVNYYLKNLGNYGLGAGRAVSATFTLEIV